MPGSRSPSPPPRFIPTYPFADAPGADAILRSADGADFYIHRVILSLVSPVFETMFQLPQPDTAPSVPVIDVQETATVLDRALRFFYPAAHASVATLEELQDIIETLVAKYDVESVVPAVKQHLERFSAAKPLAVYALACKYRWEDVAVTAAKASLKRPLRALNTEAPPELDGMTAVAYHNLLHYHQLCGTVGSRSANILDWLATPTCLGCNQCWSNNTVIFAGLVAHRVPAWFHVYLSSMAPMLMQTPSIALHEHPYFYEALGQALCHKCRSFNEFRSFVLSQWPAHLTQEMNKIKLKF
ncbi:hypothetical protein C8R46DRAFT_937822 [Mycena filopes]|nr:hypothetical protein C8R46DRAFT_937822 [Mycena filopes]